MTTLADFTIRFLDGEGRTCGQRTLAALDDLDACDKAWARMPRGAVDFDLVGKPIEGWSRK